MRPYAVLSGSLCLVTSGKEHEHIIYRPVSVIVIKREVNLVIGKYAGFLYHFCRILVIPVTVISSVVCPLFAQCDNFADCKGKIHSTVELCVEIFFCASCGPVLPVALLGKHIHETLLAVPEFHVLVLCENHKSVLRAFLFSGPHIRSGLFHDSLYQWLKLVFRADASF